jgi:Leucine-rich repeat (LRR) protein
MDKRDCQVYLFQIHIDAFTSLRHLEELNLGQNSLTYVSERMFENLKELKKLMLFSNNLTYLGVYSFYGLKKVTNLMLNNNNLHDFDSDVFAPMVALTKLRLDSNKLQFLPANSLDRTPMLKFLKLGKNIWYCDCRAIYLARWLRQYGSNLLDGDDILCRGPGPLGGQNVINLRFDDLCLGQWASMVNLSPRLPIRKQNFDEPQKPALETTTSMDKLELQKVDAASEKPDFELIDYDE